MFGRFCSFRLNLYVIGMFSAVGSLYAMPVQAAYEKNYIGEMETYEAEYEDTLVHLAREHGLGFVEIRAANPDLDPWIPGDGAEVVLPKRNLLPSAAREGLVINLPEMRVYAYLNGNDAPYTFPIGIGREGLATPTGKTSIVRKTEGPTWRPTERMLKENPKLEKVVPPGPENPLGTHALYFGWPTYAMHGTNKPYGIGRRVSSGCIRMYPEDIKEFFKLVPVGTKVQVIDEPVKVAWIDNELYIEVHPTMEQSIKMEEYGAVEQYEFSDKDIERVIDVAGKYHEYLNWPRVRMALRERKGYPVRIARTFEDDVIEVQQEEDVKPKAKKGDEPVSAEVRAAPEPKMKPKTVSQPKQKIEEKPDAALSESKDDAMIVTTQDKQERSNLNR